MVYDPLYDFIHILGLPWWLLWILYSTLFVLYSIGFLFLSGGEKRLTKEYFKDPLGAFLWPYLVLGPISGAYVLVGQMGNNIAGNLNKMGQDFNIYSLHLTKVEIFFWVALVISTIIGIEGVIRYRKYRPKIWLNRPKAMHPIMIIIFNIPMGIMAIMSIIRLIDQWAVIHNFLSSGWLPISPYNIDKMYGLKWLYQIIISQITLATICSFGSLIMLVREGTQKYSWRYKALFFVSIITISVALLVLSLNMNVELEKIHSTYLSNYMSIIDDINAFSANADTTTLLQQILITNKIGDLYNLPSGIPIPGWLSNIVSFRLFLLIIEAYGMIAKPLGWNKVPESISNFLKKIA